MDALPDIVWRRLSEKGIQHNYERWVSDAMPRPKARFLVPVFDQATWDEMMQVIQEALEIWKAQVVVGAQEPEPTIKVSG